MPVTKIQTTICKNSKNGYLLAALAALQWSTLGILGKFLFSYNTSLLTIVSLRAIMASLVLFLFLFAFRRSCLIIRRKDLFFFAAYGLFGVAAGFFFYLKAVELAGVAITSFLLYCYPVFVTILAIALLGERLTTYKTAALMLTTGGVILLSGIYNPFTMHIDFSGIALALLAALSAASSSIFGKKAVARYSNLTILFYSCAFGALFLCLAHAIFAGFPIIRQSLSFWGLIIAMVCIPTLGASLTYLSALTQIEASRASIMATLEPVVATAFAFLFFREILTIVQMLGACLVVAGVLVIVKPMDER